MAVRSRPSCGCGPKGRDGADVWLPTFWPGTRQPVEASVSVGGRELVTGGAVSANATQNEIAGELPLLLKSVRIVNEGSDMVTVETVTVDMFNWERYNNDLRVFTDYYDVCGKSRRRDDVHAGSAPRRTVAFPPPRKNICPNCLKILKPGYSIIHVYNSGLV